MGTRKSAHCVITIAAIMCLSWSGSALSGGAAATLAKDCGQDLKTYCSNVTPGSSRLVACVIAHEDKVAPRCRLTAYLASGSLGDRLKTLQSMAKTCSSDILQYCSGIKPGGGRIYDCIKKNHATLTDDCRKGFDSLPPL